MKTILATSVSLLMSGVLAAATNSGIQTDGSATGDFDLSFTVSPSVGTQLQVSGLNDVNLGVLTPGIDPATFEVEFCLYTTDGTGIAEVIQDGIFLNPTIDPTNPRIPFVITGDNNLFIDSNIDCLGERPTSISINVGTIPELNPGSADEIYTTTVTINLTTL